MIWYKGACSSNRRDNFLSPSEHLETVNKNLVIERVPDRETLFQTSNMSRTLPLSLVRPRPQIGYRAECNTLQHTATHCNTLQNTNIVVAHRKMKCSFEDCARLRSCKIAKEHNKNKSLFQKISSYVKIWGVWSHHLFSLYCSAARCSTLQCPCRLVPVAGARDACGSVLRQHTATHSRSSSRSFALCIPPFLSSFSILPFLSRSLTLALRYGASSTRVWEEAERRQHCDTQSFM